jgi:AAA domain
MYTPPQAIAANKLPTSPRRLGIQGAAGVGKTFASLTFPNVIYADIDNKFTGYRAAHPECEVPTLPFWNRKFVTEVCKCFNNGNREETKYPPNTRDAVKYWIVEEASKLTPDQTLVLDSWTSLQIAFDIQSNLPHEQVRSPKTGELDTFAFWRAKKNYTRELTDALKRLSCSVVLICHETPDRDDDGKIIGIKVLMEGAGADELPTQFTDWYRQKYFAKFEDAIGVYPKLERSVYDLSKGYMWQTEKDKYFQTACKSNPKLAPLVPAVYSSLTIS